jgi:regulator of cell morphogenesis and NO signaling
MQVHETIAELVTRLPHAAKVMHRHGIDFCCGGRQPVGAACAARGLPPEVLLAEIEAAAPPGPLAKSWDVAPIGDLIDHILVRYHRPLDAELPRLEELSRKVASVHGATHPDAKLGDVRDLVVQLVSDLVGHMHKEEQVLFPWIRAHRKPRPSAPIHVMESEHVTVAEILRDLRSITGGYEVPTDACGSWTALWRGLEALELDLHEHIHLENNVLHPRALQG